MKVNGIGTPDDGGSNGNRAPGALAVILVLAIPLVLVGNTLLILLVPWHADLQYASPGFPDPPPAISASERSSLAHDGILSIWPLGPGDSALEEARLESGGEAFGSGEISHMSDVRGVVTGILALWLASVLITAAIFLRYPRQSLISAVRAGAVLTLASFAVVGLASVLAFDQLFTIFHEVLFDDGTWTFPLDSTLIGLYPERFWVTATGAFVLLATLQALGLLWWAARERRPGPARSRMPG